MSSQTFVPDRSKPNPHRRPLANRKTTLRKITFVRNWETSSPIQPYSFNLESILQSPERAASLSPVPVVVAHPSPVYSSEEDEDAERQNDADDEDDSVIPETQDQYRHSRAGPIDFDEEDIIPDTQPAVKETPPSKRPSSSSKKRRSPLKSQKSTSKKTPSHEKSLTEAPNVRKSQRLSTSPYSSNREVGVESLKKQKSSEKSKLSPSSSKKKKASKPIHQQPTPKSGDLRKFILTKGSDFSPKLTSAKKKRNEKSLGETSRSNASKTVAEPENEEDLDVEEQPSEDGVPPAATDGEEDDEVMPSAQVRRSSSESEEDTFQRRNTSRRKDTSQRTDTSRRQSHQLLFQSPSESVPSTPRLSMGEPTRTSFRLLSVLETPRSGPVVRTRRRITSGSRDNVTKSPKKHAPKSPKKTRQEKDPDGCPIRLWQGDAETRRVTEVIDLDVILNCFEETAWEMRHQHESMTLKKALNVFAKHTQEDLRKTIASAASINKQRLSALRSRTRLSKAKKELMEAQMSFMQLKNDVASLKSRQEKITKQQS